MAKVVARLFKDLKAAERATNELKLKGYKPEEIGTLGCEKDAQKLSAVAQAATTKTKLPEIGDLVSTGPIAAAVTEAGAPATSDELAAAVSKALDTSEEAYKYYEFGISIGGILVSVHTDEAKMAQARQILRSAEAAPERAEMSANSPGFVAAGRMSATNPIDAPMSGDFRKY